MKINILHKFWSIFILLVSLMIFIVLPKVFAVVAFILTVALFFWGILGVLIYFADEGEGLENISGPLIYL